MSEKTIGYKKDGEAWCATFSNFVDLEESPAGFGKTKEEAFLRLLVGNLNENTPDYCSFVMFPDTHIVYDVDDNGGGESLFSEEEIKGRDISSVEFFNEIKTELKKAKK